MNVLIRTPIPAAGLVATFRHEIGDLDRNALIWLGPYDLADRLSAGRVYGDIRNQTVLLLIFAVVALLLASIGLYAVIAHSVSERTQEFGVRMTIGATRRDIFILVLRQGMLPLAVGLIIGIPVSLAVNRVLRAELMQVAVTDPTTYTGLSVVLIASAMLGCWIPARRAMQVDPADAVRHV
jgi:putative ABC transport system permease protein